MRILVVGGGGREHALAWKLASEPAVTRVFCAPGNPGVDAVAEPVPLRADDVDGLLAFVRQNRIDLTVVGPELPLDRGIVDVFLEAEQRIFGPTRAAAQLECSKAFAKAFMARHGIPTARYRTCRSAAEAKAVVDSGELGLPLVVKADGLAAGKGVVVAETRAAADSAIHAAMEARQFGEAGTTLVLEECLTGPEVSFFVLADGRRALPLTSAQDHKRVLDDDRGPNTGGMGAFAPSPLFDAAMEARVMDDIVRPLVAGLRSEGTEYRGFLYVGLMLTCAGPKVIEFNVRFGDPEAQVVMPLLDGDLAPLLLRAAEGELTDARVPLRPIASVGVVLASAGYPGSVRNGAPIDGLEDAATVPDVTVFHAGTSVEADRVVTAGGRVLTVVATGGGYAEARQRAYEAASLIRFDGMHYRRDIGLKALTMSTPNSAMPNSQLPTPNSQLPTSNA